MSKEREMICKNCKGNAFSFKWKIKDEKHGLTLMFCHTGIGFQLTDSIIKCVKCGKESEYELEDFLEIIEADLK